ncbi:hypothetical protein V1524DRAFT_41240 [Lipomyces starkeyi]
MQNTYQRLHRTKPTKYDCCHLTPCVRYLENTKGTDSTRNVVLKVSRRVRRSLTRPSLTFHLSRGSVPVQEYPSEIMPSNGNGTLVDFWNGDIVQRRLHADGFLRLPTEIALSLPIDGVQTS